MEVGRTNNPPTPEIDFKFTEEELEQLLGFEPNEKPSTELSMPDGVAEMPVPPKENEQPKNSSEINQNAIKTMNNNLFVFNATKAGMPESDKERIAKIIEEASKGSEFYKRQKEKLEGMKARVSEKAAELEKFKKDEIYYLACEVAAKDLVEEYRKELDVSRTWIHVDMDMFYAAVEIRDNPDLADKPIAVGGYSMISTTNYVARKYGVRSAMPGFIGKKLCPDLIFVHGNYKKYGQISHEIMSILAEYDPQLESMGLDEASLDVTDHLVIRGYKTDEEKISLAKEIQKRIWDKVKLTASCGIGANRLLAKISCDMHKPNGITLVPFTKEAVINFMEPLSVRKIPNIGKVGEQLLNGLGYFTCKDFIDKATDLYILFKEDNFEWYIRHSLGIGHNVHAEETEGVQKSISASQTFRNITLYF